MREVSRTKSGGLAILQIGKNVMERRNMTPAFIGTGTKLVETLPISMVRFLDLLVQKTNGI
jgi:hypothetical protein